jgi:hypothetical protein
MTVKGRWTRVAAAAALAAAAMAAYVLACGPFVTTMRPVEHVRPGRVGGYDRGDVGIVREHFARRFLVQAFRRFNGRPPIPVVPRATAAAAQSVLDAIKNWQAFRVQVAGAEAAVDIDVDRSQGNYQMIRNCLQDTFVKALATGRARADKYGLQSDQVRDWVTAEDAVLSNCSGGLTLPEPAPADAEARVRADRAYQTAAAYFYGERYDEAADRFRRIAIDTSSPWRPYGHYLAGRARLRQATLADPLDVAKLQAAATELRATLADPNAAFLHASAAGLIDFATYRLDPATLLHDLSATLATADTATAEQVNTYERLMDVLLDDHVRYDYADVKDRDAIVRSGELGDWVLVMQGTGDAATDRAVEQWKRSPSPAWLVAALWKVHAHHPDAPALLDAAAKMPAASPAYLTIGFLRVRLLAERGDSGPARAVLATLPRTAATDDDTETINLLNAERFMLARSMDELLEFAPRYIVSKRVDGSDWRDAEESPDPGPLKRDRVFDDDAGIVFSDTLPLARLVAASVSGLLPARLRLRIASAAFTRAFLLDRMEDALKVAPVLRRLSPAAAADIRRFESAAPDDRHIAGVRLLLRTPGLRATVRGIEDDQDEQKGLSRSFDHVFQRTWWCAFSSSFEKKREWPADESEVLTALYRSSTPAPSFLTRQERAAVTSERAALAKLGTGAVYLADQAVEWAKSRPQDLDAAEALAHAVEGTHWASCGDPNVSAHSRAAFQSLHKLFPQTEWARKT